jgi:guanylate kinase
MKYTFILGMSGSGKTRLAQKIESSLPIHLKKITQCTTRKPRPDEVEGKDYYFLSDEEYDKYDQMGWLIGQVREELLPARYGTPLRDMSLDKNNVLVLSIEGFLDAITKVRVEDSFSVIFIKNVKPEIAREGRDQQSEEKYISTVLHWAFRQNNFRLIEIDHDELKKFRDNKEKVIKFVLENNLITDDI